MRGKADDRNKLSIEKSVKAHKGQLVIYSGEIRRLIGYIDVKREDYYYELQDMFGCTSFCSCVLDVIPLKKYLPIKEYNALEDLWILNENQKVEK